MEQLKPAGDLGAVATAVATLFGYMPSIAATLSAIWMAIRIYETRTVQKWLGRWKRGE